MQCNSCRFENMPGVDHCGRCGAVLRLAAAIDIHPPRAGKWTKRLRQWLPTLASLRRPAIPSARGYGAYEPLEGPEFPVLLRMVVPGWPQVYLGRRASGRWFLFSYLGCLIASVVLFGTQLGSVFLGIAVALHASSIVDVILSNMRNSQGRIRYALGCCAAVAALLYLPAGWLTSQVASPRRLLQPALPFAPGDVVLVNSWRLPEAGDVVLYDVPPARMAGRWMGYPALLQIEGERIDRILAGPGQRVVIKAGHVTVDGQPVAYLPLNPARMPAELSIEVPWHSFLILPTTVLHNDLDLHTLDWNALGVVPASDVIGKIYLRHYPMQRFWWVR